MIDNSITYGEYVISNLMRFYSIKDLFYTLTLFRSKFDNYLTVLWKNKTRDHSIAGKLKNSPDVPIANIGELMAILYDFAYDSNKDIVSLISSGH